MVDEIFVCSNNINIETTLIEKGKGIQMNSVHESSGGNKEQLKNNLAQFIQAKCTCLQYKDAILSN